MINVTRHAPLCLLRPDALCSQVSSTASVRMCQIVRTRKNEINERVLTGTAVQRSAREVTDHLVISNFELQASSSAFLSDAPSRVAPRLGLGISRSATSIKSN